jgi:DHA1 family tetracycline resistance protein-like MFS transporter
MSERDTPRASGRAAVAFIFITVLLDMMAFGMVAPVLPRLVTEFVSQDASTAALVYNLFNTVFALLQFLFSPLIGALSDRFGRRPLILASNLGLGLTYALMAWAPPSGWGSWSGRPSAGCSANTSARARPSGWRAPSAS